MKTAEQFDADAAKYLALAMDRDVSISRARALMGISHNFTILAEQHRRLAQIEEDKETRDLRRPQLSVSFTSASRANSN
jgi:hypothetical protein